MSKWYGIFRWCVPTGKRGVPQNVVHNFRMDFPEIVWSICFPTEISGIFGWMVSFLKLCQVTKLSVSGLLAWRLFELEMLIFDGRNPYISEGKNFTFRRVSGKDAYYNLRSALSSRMEVRRSELGWFFGFGKLTVESVVCCLVFFLTGRTPPDEKALQSAPKQHTRDTTTQGTRWRQYFFNFRIKYFFYLTDSHKIGVPVPKHEKIRKTILIWKISVQ